MAHQKGGLWGWRSQFRVLYLMYQSCLLALKWHLIYQNWSKHSNCTTEKGLKILRIFFFFFFFFWIIIFWKISSVSKKTHTCKVFSFHVLYHICDVIKQNESELAITVFKIQPNKADSFFCFLLFVQSFNCLHLWNQLPNLCGGFHQIKA